MYPSENNKKTKGYEAHQHCRHCRHFRSCLSSTLSGAHLAHFESLIEQEYPVRRGTHLYRTGDPFKYLYIVRSGSFKTYAVTDDCEERIQGFAMPGDVLGVDAIHAGAYPSAAKSLEVASVCAVPYPEVEKLASRVLGLHRRLMHLASRKLFNELQMVRTIANCRAEQRLAQFLIHLSERFREQGLSPYRFRLPMTHQELANYLGLTPATLSRLFRRFEANGWVSTVGRAKEILLEQTVPLWEISGLKGRESGT